MNKVKHFVFYNWDFGEPTGGDDGEESQIEKTMNEFADSVVEIKSISWIDKPGSSHCFIVYEDYP